MRNFIHEGLYYQAILTLKQKLIYRPLVRFFVYILFCLACIKLLSLVLPLSYAIGTGIVLILFTLSKNFMVLVPTVFILVLQILNVPKMKKLLYNCELEFASRLQYVLPILTEHMNKEYQKKTGNNVGIYEIPPADVLNYFVEHIGYREYSFTKFLNHIFSKRTFSEVFYKDDIAPKQKSLKF